MQFPWPPPFASHDLDSEVFDEMFKPPGVQRTQYQALFNILQTLSPDELQRHQQVADQSFLLQGITFTLYGNNEGTERIFPYDLLPRIITSGEWDTIEAGLTQRITTLNLFLHDVYHQGKILADRTLPNDLVYSAQH